MDRLSSYKTRNFEKSTVKFRLECEQNRRDSRLSLMLRRRNITTALSPIDSPLPIKKQIKEKPIVEDKQKKRYEMLQKYKEEKKKKIAELKAKSKPVFKVQHISNSTSTDFAKLYQKLKVNCNVLSNKAKASNSIINKSTGTIKKPLCEKPATKLKKTTESLLPNKPNASNTIINKSTGTIKKPLCEKPATKLKKTTENSRCLSSVQSSNNKSTQEAFETNFSETLSNEIERLKGLCKEWKMYEEESKPSEEACDMIHMAVGQTELLIKNKFRKFAELISLQQSNNAECKVTLFDLHGFWDVVSMEIKNVDQRFKSLSTLKTNNWNEVLPPPVKKRRSIKNNDKKKTEVKSNIRDFIRDKRKNNLQNQKQPTSTALFTLNNPINVSNQSPNQNFKVLALVQSSKMNTPKEILKCVKGTPVKKSKSVLFIKTKDKENSPRRSTRIRSKIIQSSSDLDIDLYV